MNRRSSPTPLCGTSIETCATLERIINPGVPIPPASTAVHGLSDADVAKSPAFRDVAGEIMAYVGPRIIIGHSIGYDLAILRREHELAGLPWRQPPSLCIRVLARLVAPTLADHSLDRLAEWLGIRIEGRHTAMGDTRATAEVFAALVPLLRQGGIRTLAEAQAASTRLFEDEARQSGGLAAEAKTAGFETPRPLVRIDSFPYRHKVRDVMSAPALWVSPETTVGALISLLLERKVSSVFVRSASGEHGIVTERDALRAIDAKGAAGLATPVGEIMITPLQSVSADAFVYRAIGRMTRMGFRHLAVRDVNNEIIGAVTTRNLLRHRGTTAIVLGDQIDSAEDVATLGSAWAKVPLMARSLLDEDVDRVVWFGGPETLATAGATADLDGGVTGPDDLGQPEREAFVGPGHTPTALRSWIEHVDQPRSATPRARRLLLDDQSGVHELGEMLTDGVVVESEVLGHLRNIHRPVGVGDVAEHAVARRVPQGSGLLLQRRHG